ncbi:truncated transposase [Streptococcus dysgalactiae subsp. equisimilis GGS_124]|nr:truncated transposase [Streptococcus dysgalactiae subsp. equisimilis GGS_124]
MENKPSSMPILLIVDNVSMKPIVKRVLTSN